MSGTFNSCPMSLLPQKLHHRHLSYLPEENVTPSNGQKIVIDHFRDHDREEVFVMMKAVVDEGRAFLYDAYDMDIFNQAFASQHSFVVRDRSTQDVLAALCFRPWLPGRSSHIAYMTFVVKPEFRHRGLGELIVHRGMTFARDLGFNGALNGVYSNNVGSVRLCQKLGMREVGCVPNAGILKGGDVVDCFFFYQDLGTLDNSDKINGTSDD